MDLEKVDFGKMVDASILDAKLKNLMWITPEYSNDPLKELNLLKMRSNTSPGLLPL